MAIIGIDLGTTNSLVSVWKDGKAQLIPNSFGEYLTPSIVSFGEDGEVFVGKIAKEMLITNPTRTFKEFKRDMGTDIKYMVDGKSYSPEELSAFVLKKLKEDAEAYLGETVNEAVISVPAYFDDDKRCATKNAGKLAGIKVDRLINEPSAVALKNHSIEDSETFIVFDFGGGTLDVSLVDAFENMVEIVAVAGDNRLGGKDFNEVIAKDFYETNYLNAGLLSEEERGMIIKEAELLKMDLTKSNSASRKIYIQNIEYEMSMTNKRLIQISKDLFIRMSEPIKKVINDGDISMDDVDKLILVGGSSKMPIVAKYIESIVDMEVVLDGNPDESIAMGVGTAAGIKERTGDIKDMILSDICPFSLGVGVVDGTFSPIISRNEVLPCSITKLYSTSTDNQTRVDIPIFQGENLMALDNLKLGEVSISNITPAPKGSIPILVTFMYDINGILDIKVVCENHSTQKVIMNKNIGLTEEELAKKIEELKKITMHPVENEQNRFLIEKANRLFRESDERKRMQIVEVLNDFKKKIRNEKDFKKIRAEQVNFSIILNNLEGGQFSFDNFDESFWDENDEND